MKKKILSLAMVMVSMVAFSGMAQKTTGCPKEKQECCAKGKKCKPDINCKFNPYEGLNLTDGQKARLQQLEEKRIADRKAKAKEAKAEKQRKDSVNKEARKDAKRQYLQEVKEIIGPDQYVIYLENMVINGPEKGHGPNFDLKIKKLKSETGMRAKGHRHPQPQADSKE